MSLARCAQENYGVKNSESEARVKAVYQELELAREFEEYEHDSYTRINGLIDAIPAEGSADGLKREVYQSFLAKVYKRQKCVPSLPLPLLASVVHVLMTTCLLLAGERSSSMRSARGPSEVEQ